MWQGDKPEGETRAAIAAGEGAYSHGGTFYCYLSAVSEKVYGNCTLDGCEGCDLCFESVGEYCEWLNGT